MYSNPLFHVLDDYPNMNDYPTTKKELIEQKLIRCRTLSTVKYVLAVNAKKNSKIYN